MFWHGVIDSRAAGASTSGPVAAPRAVKECVAKFADERVLPPDMPHPVLADKLLSRVILVTRVGCALGGAAPVRRHPVIRQFRNTLERPR